MEHPTLIDSSGPEFSKRSTITGRWHEGQQMEKLATLYIYGFFISFPSCTAKSLVFLLQQFICKVCRLETALFHHLDTTPILTICAVQGQKVLKLEEGRVYIMMWLHEARNGAIHWRRSIEAMRSEMETMEAATFFDVISNSIVNNIRQDVLFSTQIGYHCTLTNMITMVEAYLDRELMNGGGGPMTDMFTNLQKDDMTNAIWSSENIWQTVDLLVEKFVPNRPDDVVITQLVEVFYHARKIARKLKFSQQNLAKFCELELPISKCGAAASSGTSWRK